MRLRESKGDMYPWVDRTGNPWAGRCSHRCSYCFMNNFRKFTEKYKGEPRVCEKELEDGIQRLERFIIFVGSATDGFQEEMPDSAIKRVLRYCRRFDHIYLFQTKNPARFSEFLDEFPEKSILGTTIETNRDYNISNAPEPKKRFEAFRDVEWNRKMVSVEPIMDFNLDILVKWLRELDLDFVSVGADSEGHNLPEPEGRKIRDLIQNVEEFTEVKVKENLSRLF